jgi:hypothetical protein
MVSTLLIIIFTSNWRAGIGENQARELQQSKSVVFKRGIEVALDNHQRNLQFAA